MLYNPSAISGFGGYPRYFTYATLTAVFDASPRMADESPYVRSQNVGSGGEASLKLTASNPKSSSIALPGMGGLSLFEYLWRHPRKTRLSA